MIEIGGVSLKPGEGIQDKMEPPLDKKSKLNSFSCLHINGFEFFENFDPLMEKNSMKL